MDIYLQKCLTLLKLWSIKELYSALMGVAVKKRKRRSVDIEDNFLKFGSSRFLEWLITISNSNPL